MTNNVVIKTPLNKEDGIEILNDLKVMVNEHYTEIKNVLGTDNADLVKSKLDAVLRLEIIKNAPVNVGMDALTEEEYNSILNDAFDYEMYKNLPSDYPELLECTSVEQFTSIFNSAQQSFLELIDSMMADYPLLKQHVNTMTRRLQEQLATEIYLNNA